MKKTVFIVSAGIAAVSCTTKVTKHEARRPNIIYIMSDDHGYQAISAYGSSLIKTPNIDRIGDEGMRFNNCFVMNSLFINRDACK